MNPLVIDYDDPEFEQQGEMLGEIEYEAFIQNGDRGLRMVAAGRRMGRDLAQLHFSGTTGNPKGVVYHHRGAALMGYSNTIACGMMNRFPVYLWTLPMFHCNGWCFPWSVSVVAGTHVCLRWVRAAKAMYDAIADHGVTHLCGAPIVMSILLQAGEDERREFNHTRLSSPMPRRHRLRR